MDWRFTIVYYKSNNVIQSDIEEYKEMKTKYVNI